VSPPARLLLVRHAPTAATRRRAFPLDEPLDDRGRGDAARLAGRLTADRLVVGPAAACHETAAAAGLDPAGSDPRWAGLDVGRWAGRRLEDVAGEDADGIGRWLSEPASTPHGGESVVDLRGRIAAAMAELDVAGTTTLVVTAAEAVAVAVLTALAAPLTSLWRVDVEPCAVTTLHARPDGSWSLRSLNEPVAAGVAA
jgi:broad specificity phosphatase PhoE